MWSLLLGLILLFSSSVTVADSLTLSSSQLSQVLEERSLHLRVSKELKKGAEERQGVLGRSFLPSFDLRASQEQFREGRKEVRTGPVLSAELNFNLYRGGRDAAENKLASLELERQNHILRRNYIETLERLRKHYWSLLFLREKKQLLEQMKEVNLQNQKAAVRRIQGGLATQSDKFEFEMKDTEYSQDLIRLQLEDEAERSSIRVLLNLESNVEIQIADKFEHNHDFLKQFEHKASDHDHLFKPDELEAAQLLQKSDKESRWILPQLDLFFSWTQFNEREKDFADAEDRRESLFGLKLSFPLGAGYESQRESAALAAEARAKQLEVEVAKRELEAHLQSEIGEVRLLHDLVHDAEENIKRAEKYYQLTQAEYSRGVKNSPDVLGASEKLYSARLRRLEIVRDFQFAQVHVLAKIGQ